MSMFLYAVGAICVVAGAAMAAFGVPVAEFSFGNTLIMTGAVTAVGGLIVIGLGAVVSRLQQIVEAGYGQGAGSSQRPFETYEGAPAHTASGRIPFPPKPRPGPKPKQDTAPEAEREPLPAVIAPTGRLPREEPVEQSLAPTLPNPDEPPVTVAENVTLSPQHPNGGPAEHDDFGTVQDDREAAREEDKASFDKEWPAEPAPAAEKRGSFSFMWPERKTEKAAPAKEEPVALEVAPPEPAHDAEPVSEPAPALTQEEPPAEAPRNVAVLKSGVVDGMGYTLYVDGSIEAELPQGTLRFASINELRAHLEQNT